MPYLEPASKQEKVSMTWGGMFAFPRAVRSSLAKCEKLQSLINHTEKSIPSHLHKPLMLKWMSNTRARTHTHTHTHTQRQSLKGNTGIAGQSGRLHSGFGCSSGYGDIGFRIQALRT